jgi:hypothetical protein
LPPAREIVSIDISQVLRDWKFDPESITVRQIVGDDGRQKIQLRLDLGVLQMEVDGRPDGETVQGFASWLDFYRSQQQAHDAANPDAARFLLDTEDCAQLLREGVQYYHRYISFWHLKRYELCARDTRRNLELFAFIREHARYDRDKVQFDQWRPYVTMMHARAVATPLVELNQWEAAIGAIDAGINGVQQFLDDYGQSDKADQLSELVFLKRWRREIGRQLTSDESSDLIDDDQVDLLRKQLEEAVADERYEEAASLRDQLSRLEEPPPPEPLGG